MGKRERWDMVDRIRRSKIEGKWADYGRARREMGMGRTFARGTKIHGRHARRPGARALSMCRAKISIYANIYKRKGGTYEGRPVQHAAFAREGDAFVHEFFLYHLIIHSVGISFIVQSAVLSLG